VQPFGDQGALMEELAPRWEARCESPTDTVAALPGMDQHCAHTLLSAPHAAQTIRQEANGA
jgi:hypothetical protein